jgi:hypothetical protein
MQTSLQGSAKTARARAAQQISLQREATEDGRWTVWPAVSVVEHGDWEELLQSAGGRQDANPAPMIRVVASVPLLCSMVGLRSRSWGRLLSAQAALGS